MPFTSTAQTPPSLFSPSDALTGFHALSVEPMAKSRTFARPKAPGTPTPADETAPPARPTSVTSPDVLAAEALLQRLSQELPQAQVIAVVEVATGRCLAGQVPTPTTDLAGLARLTATMMQQCLQAGLPTNAPLELLITTSAQFHFLKALDDAGRQFVFLAVPRDQTSLALVREVLLTHTTPPAA